MKRHDHADVAGRVRFEKIASCGDHCSLSDPVPEVVGASWTGAADARFGAGGGVLAAAGAGYAAGAGGVAAVAERDAGGDAGAAAAGAGDGFSGGSGVMMLTGGVDAEVGNSALVGLPVGMDAGNAATRPAVPCPGAFHDAA